MKICLIGNSHIACIREAWSENDYGLDITFFGSYGTSILNTVNRENVIVATNQDVKNNFKITSSYSENIHLDNYDIIVCHGLLQSLINYFKYFATINSNIFYSNEVIKKSNLFYKSVFFHVLSEIRKTSDIIVISSASPHPVKRENINILNDISYKNTLSSLHEISMKYSFSLLHQHEATVENYFYTIERFTKGSKTFDVNNITSLKMHPDNDFIHMNAEFGHLYLQQLKMYLDNFNR